jgi:hypothetical protein
VNLAPVEPLSLVQELSFFENSIKLDHLLPCFLDLFVNNMIIGFLLYAVMVEIYWFQLLCYLLGVQ